ncbi:MAG TPA: hypothetical protein P5548_04440 [Candidatus Moranbacteria bacterium]|nr:hypothetical protein [Candidatus Moranbacteria bacterium]HRZ34118.1 hypothetical protein [Candidatus Moranbacteria bacterium]
MERKFCFNGKEVTEVIRKERASGKKKRNENPRPERLKNCSQFVGEAWDIWFHLHPALKKQLRKKSPNKSLVESNGNTIFEFKFEKDEFKLDILQDWAAERLGLPKEYKSRKQNINVIMFCAEVLEKVGVLKKGTV